MKSAGGRISIGTFCSHLILIQVCGINLFAVQKLQFRHNQVTVGLIGDAEPAVGRCLGSYANAFAFQKIVDHDWEQTFCHDLIRLQRV